MGQSLAVKYRPQNLDDLIGEELTVKILKKVIEKKSFKNCLGFFGFTGVGKTTSARAFAKAINAEIIEVSAASDRGIDTIRYLDELAKKRSLSNEYKVIILDECHMLTSEAQSAALKLLEETPKYTIFILCSTDPEKILPTILNRCQKYNFHPISTEKIKNRLFYICEQEKFTNYQETCDLISKRCNGSVREAITLLEQCADLDTNLTLETAELVLGKSNYDTLFNFTGALLNKDEKSILETVDNLEASGLGLKAFIDQYISFCIDLSKYCLYGTTELTNIPNYLASRCAGFSKIPDALKFSNNLISKLLELKNMIKYDTSYKNTIIAYFINLIRNN